MLVQVAVLGDTPRNWHLAVQVAAVATGLLAVRLLAVDNCCWLKIIMFGHETVRRDTDTVLPVAVAVRAFVLQLTAHATWL